MQTEAGDDDLLRHRITRAIVHGSDFDATISPTGLPLTATGLAAVEQRDREKCRALFEDLLEDIERSPSAPKHGLYDALNDAMSGILRRARSSDDPEHQRYMTYVAAGLLHAEIRRHASHATSQQWSTQGPVPEDAILTEMAGLLADAKGRDGTHQAAIAVAAAEITRSVMLIKNK